MTATATPTPTVELLALGQVRTITLIDETTEGLVPSPDGRVHIEFRRNSVESLVQVNLATVDVSQAPKASTNGELTLAHAFDISISRALSRMAIERFSTPVVISVSYTDADLELAGGDPSRLALARLDPLTNNWILQHTNVDPTAQVLSTESAEPGLWGVMATLKPTASESSSSPDGDAAVTALNTETGELRSLDGRTVVEFSRSVVDPLGRVSLNTVAVSQAPRAPSDAELTLAFELSAVERDGVALGRFSEPVAVKVFYTLEDLDAADGDPLRLALARFDPVAREWVLVPTEIDHNARLLSASVSEPGLWGVIATEPTKASLGTPLWVWIPIGGVLAALAFLYIAAYRRWEAS